MGSSLRPLRISLRPLRSKIFSDSCGKVQPFTTKHARNPQQRNRPKLDAVLPPHLSPVRRSETMFPQHQGGTRLEVPATRLPGSRTRAPEEGIDGETGQERYLWSASHPDAGHAQRLPLLAVRFAFAIAQRSRRAMPQVRFRTALLQAVHLLRPLEPVRVHSTHSGTYPAQGPAQPVLVLFNTRDGGEGDFHPRCPASQRRPPGF